jgi:hypothetical protein
VNGRNLLVILLIYSLGVGAATLVDSAKGTGYDIATGVAFGMLFHAAYYFGHLYYESRKAE